MIDLLARLDGIDFRQTAPVRPGTPFLRPYGAEWVASEDALSRPLPGIEPTMIARAGALDQGNIVLNLADAERRGIQENVLFLAGSAINSIKNATGHAEARIGIEFDAAGDRGPQLGRAEGCAGRGAPGGAVYRGGEAGDEGVGDGAEGRGMRTTILVRLGPNQKDGGRAERGRRLFD